MLRLIRNVALIIAVSTAPVTAGDFTGLSVWAGGQKISTDAKFGDIDDGSRFEFGSSDVGLSFGADYGVALSERGRLFFGVSWSDSVPLGGFAADGTVASMKAKDAVSLYVAPGAKISDSTLIYLKASYSESKGVLNGVSRVDGPFYFSDTDKSFGYGIGLRTYLTEKIFLNAEYEAIEYEYSLAGTISIDASVNRSTLAFGFNW